MNTTKKVGGCRFCDAAGRVWDTLSFAPDLQPDECVYRWGKKTFLTIDKHPVTDACVPYFLLVPYQHYTSFRVLPEEMGAEVDAMIAFAERAVRLDQRTSKLANRIIFEHGQSRDGNKVKSIYHAHLHVLFGDFPAERILAYTLEELARLEVPYQVVPSGRSYLATLHQNVPTGMDYLFFSVNNTEVVALDDGNDRIYSQFFRQILARTCDAEFINWKSASESQNDTFRSRLYRSLPRNPEPWTEIPLVAGADAVVYNEDAKRSWPRRCKCGCRRSW